MIVYIYLVDRIRFCNQTGAGIILMDKTQSSTELPDLKRAKAQTILGWALETFHPEIALASSFSMEDIILIDMGMQLEPQLRVFAIDTGRMNEETYIVAEDVRKRYGLTIEWVFPQHAAVETLEREKGLYSFRESIANRHACCAIRKVEPLSRALKGLRAWVTGMRREQSVTRAVVQAVEFDAAHRGIVKVNPLWNWTFDRVRDYVKRYRLPVNRLYDKGYTSIGCAPCTRSVAPGEHPRAGRWWWEHPDHKECGLHVKNWEI